MNTLRLTKGDAEYVEVIHTDGDLGIGTDIGDADFFVNGGVIQPGCTASKCNHDRAWDLFAASVGSNHLVGNRCSTPGQVTSNECNGPSLWMGGVDYNKGLK